MRTFLLERTIPPAFDISDPNQVALHSRWATDAYRDAGVVWLGGVATRQRMYGLVVADHRSDVEAYLKALGVGEADYALNEVITPMGPQVAMSREDPRYRPRRQIP